MKKIVVFIVFLWLFSMPVAAADENYASAYEESGAGGLDMYLSEDTREYLTDNGLDPENSGWVQNLTAGNVFTHILELLSGGITTPLKTGGAVLCIILLTAAFPAFSAAGEKNDIIPVLCIAVCIAYPIWNSISAAVSAVKGSSTFMLGFIPVFAGIVFISGGTVSSASMSALLLAATELVSAVSAFVILPVMGSYLSMSICTAVSPLAVNNDFADGIRRVAFWILSFITTVFIGILSIQTAVNSAADTLALKTGKFLIGTVVPIGGAALSEAASTVTASLSLLRSSVGIYGIVVIAVIFLPILLELLVWRFMLFFGCSVSGQFSLSGVTRLLKAVDMMLSLLVGVVLITAAMFIISLTVVVMTVKTV